MCVCVWIPTHAGFLLCESWQRFTERLGFNTQRGRERENVVGVLEWLLLCPRSHFYLSISLDLYKHCFVFVFVFKKGDFYDGGIIESWEWVCWVGEAAAACACFSWGCNRWWAFMSVFTHWNVASKLYWTERCKIQMYAHHQVAMVFFEVFWKHLGKTCLKNAFWHSGLEFKIFCIYILISHNVFTVLIKKSTYG